MALSVGTHMAVTQLKSRLSKAIEILVWLAALGVLIENISLLRQNRRLEEAAAPQIVAGTHLQMLSGLTLDGRIVPVGFPALGSRLLILTFSPGCPACQANQAKWMSLASTLGQKGGVRMLWVSRDPIEITKEYCLKRGIPLSDVLADPPYRTYTQLGLARVPNTVLLDASGTVEKVWPGRLDQDGWDTLFAYFGQRQEKPTAAQTVAGAIATACGNDSSGAPAKNCK
jgi:peroxiredoxin